MANNPNSMDSMESKEERVFASAVQYNRDPIFDVLKKYAPEDGNILEISSGTGEHAVYFTNKLINLDKAYTNLKWLPSEYFKNSFSSINAWIKYEKLENNILPPIEIDTTNSEWPKLATQVLPNIKTVVNINMVHIAPFSACRGLMRGTGQLLLQGGILYMYGPFLHRNKPNAKGNIDFDKGLREKNKEWGVRYVDEVVDAASENGLELLDIVDMPVNNLSLIFKKKKV
jgi:hypothetical protein